MSTLATVVDKFLSGRYKLERQYAKEHERLTAIAQNGKGASSHGKFYAAAQPSIDRPPPHQLTSPEDYKQAYERIVLIKMARQMEEDFPFTDLILNDFETYVVGDLCYVPSTGNAEADKVIREFLEWQFSCCDYQEQHDLIGLAKLIVRGDKRDGEMGAIIMDTGDTLKLRLVPADCIGNPLIGANIGPNNYNGIRTNPVTNAPEWYDVWKRLPHVNAYVFDQTVGASNFLHYFSAFRANQYHGVSTFKNVIDSVYDIRQLIEFVKLNMKYRASQLPYVTNEQGRSRGNGYGTPPSATDTNGVAVPMQVDVNGVTQSYMKLGEAVVEFPNDFPNQQFLPAFGEIMRLISMGCKLPPEFCYRSEAGGVLTRFHISKAERVFDEEKRRFKRFISPFKNRLIEKGIATGALDLSKFGDLATSPRRFSGSWQMGRSVSVDFGREVDADIKLIEAGLMTKEEHMADNARNPEIVREQIKNDTIKIFEDAQEVSEEVGRPLEEVLPFIVKKFPNPVMAPATIPDPTKPALTDTQK